MLGMEPSDTIQENGNVWIEIEFSYVSFIYKPADSVGESFAARKFPAGRLEFFRQGGFRHHKKGAADKVPSRPPDYTGKVHRHIPRYLHLLLLPDKCNPCRAFTLHSARDIQ